VQGRDVGALGVLACMLDAMVVIEVLRAVNAPRFEDRSLVLVSEWMRTGEPGSQHEL
jgi:hypothetical protein